MRQLLFVLLGVFVLLTGCKVDDDVVAPSLPTLGSGLDSCSVASLSISTENAAPVLSKESYVQCSVAISSANSNWNFSATAGIRGRGNSTWLWYPKKPYRIKLDKKAGLLGLNEDKDWVLLANYRDPTMLMNTFVFNLGHSMNMPYTNHSRFVEVTLNGKYIGLYLLTEQIEQGDNRVPVDEKDGYLITLDADDGPDLSPEATDNFWSSAYGLPVCVKNPSNVSATQLSTIRADFAKLESAIKSADYLAVEQQLNIQSFIDFMLVQELVYNVEVDAPRSIYLYKSKDGRWCMGPLWDFDAGFDFDWSTMYTGHNFFTSYKELVLGTNPVTHTNGYQVSSFFTDLFKSKQFVTEYKARWAEIKPKVMSESWENTQHFADSISVALAHNAQCWPIDKKPSTEIQRMKQWLTNRVNYLDEVIQAYPVGTK